MSICDKCLHREVCCDEGMGEEALTFCAHLLDERPKGKWIAQDEFGACFKCSNCGIGIDNDFPVYRSYCPNCGSDMRSAQNLSYADNDTAQGGLASAT